MTFLSADQAEDRRQLRNPDPEALDEKIIEILQIVTLSRMISGFIFLFTGNERARAKSHLNAGYYHSRAPIILL